MMELANKLKNRRKFSTWKMLVIGLVNIVQGVVTILSLGYIWPGWDMEIVMYFSLQGKKYGESKTSELS